LTQRTVSRAISSSSLAENIDRQLGAAILVLALLVQQIAHIVGQAGNAEQAGLFVQQRIDFAD
jgi:hypothetical protein